MVVALTERILCLFLKVCQLFTTFMGFIDVKTYTGRMLKFFDPKDGRLLRLDGSFWLLVVDQGYASVVS